jgi:hypothetical protein
LLLNKWFFTGNCNVGQFFSLVKSRGVSFRQTVWLLGKRIHTKKTDQDGEHNFHKQVDFDGLLISTKMGAYTSASRCK